MEKKNPFSLPLLHYFWLKVIKLNRTEFTAAKKKKRNKWCMHTTHTVTTPCVLYIFPKTTLRCLINELRKKKYHYYNNKIITICMDFMDINAGVLPSIIIMFKNNFVCALLIWWKNFDYYYLLLKWDLLKWIKEKMDQIF